MSENKITMEDAFQVWWHVTWRAALVLIGLNIVLNGLAMLSGQAAAVRGLASGIAIIAGIVTQVFFLKGAMNHDYKNFRLSTTTLTTEKK